jgi:uncharacterized protein YndB with AHSA1/START domain
MSAIHIVHEYPHPPTKVWRALTDPVLVPLWTAQGLGAQPEDFSPKVGTRFRFVAKPRLGWRGIVECEVLEAREASLLQVQVEDGAQARRSRNDLMRNSISNRSRIALSISESSLKQATRCRTGDSWPITSPRAPGSSSVAPLLASARRA